MSGHFGKSRKRSQPENRPEDQHQLDPCGVESPESGNHAKYPGFRHGETQGEMLSKEYQFGRLLQSVVDDCARSGVLLA